MKDYTVTISDLVTELRKSSIDDDKGVYFVFSAKPKEDGTYIIIRLLYIGRSNDVNKRVNGKHHKHDAILSECQGDSAVPVYYYAEVSPDTYDDMVRVEAALIYNKDPTLNATADREFRHPDTHIVLERNTNTTNRGKALPKPFGDIDFVVKRTVE